VSGCATEDACLPRARRCIGQSLARIMHDTAIARLYAHFSFALAPRMGGPAGVDEQVNAAEALLPQEPPASCPEDQMCKSTEPGMRASVGCEGV
jgi:hypothetical protein